jgi:biotin transport system substrate-specific component
MARATLPTATLADALWPPRAGAQLGRTVLLALAGSLLLILSAKLQVPFYPVPMTLQTLAVLLLGLTLGARLAALAVLLYLAQGALGLPVFAGTPARGLGLAYMAGPTGGYLVGFLLAATACGWLAQGSRSAIVLALAALIGLALIYLPGTLWLAGFLGFEAAVMQGVLPFLLGDLVKAALAVALALLAAGLLRRRGGHA